MAVKLIYKDMAIGAAEDAAVTTTAAESFCNVAALPFGVDSHAIATCELNGWGLMDEYKVRNNHQFSFWSTNRSGADCLFATTPTITFTFDNQYSASGLTIRFSPETMDFCRKISVVWYQGSTVLDTETYYPTDPLFVVNNSVSHFNKIVFTLHETSLPLKRAKVEYIGIGVNRTFTEKELTGVSFINEINLISNEIPVNVCDASFIGESDVEYIFQKKQPVEAYNASDLIGVYYIEEGNRVGEKAYSISCSDIIGTLDIVTHSGGLWINNTALTTILSSIFGSIVEFDIDTAYANATLRGFIQPDTTMREALQQICFALGAVADTTGSKKIRIFPAPSGTAKVIAARDTYTGGSISTSATVTEVTVTAYIITDERPGENDEYIEYNGVKYKYYTDTKHAYNPDAISSDLPNKIKFTEMYLVNLSNAQTLANNIMTQYIRNKVYSFPHVLDGEKPGDRVNAAYPWGGTVNGNITKMSLSVSNIIVSTTDMLLEG